MTKHELLYKKGYRWLACDDDGEIRAFKNKPHKKHPFDTSWSSDGDSMIIDSWSERNEAASEPVELDKFLHNSTLTVMRWDVEE